MIRRKLNKRKNFKGFKIIIDTSVVKELDIYNDLSTDELFSKQDKEEIKKAYDFYNNIKWRISFDFWLPFGYHFILEHLKIMEIIELYKLKNLIK